MNNAGNEGINVWGYTTPRLTDQFKPLDRTPGDLLDWEDVPDKQRVPVFFHNTPECHDPFSPLCYDAVLPAFDQFLCPVFHALVYRESVISGAAGSGVKETGRLRNRPCHGRTPFMPCTNLIVLSMRQLFAEYHE